MQGWVEDEDYPSRHRLPMSWAERELVDAAAFADVADWLETLPNPDETTVLAATVIAEAARLLRLDAA